MGRRALQRLRGALSFTHRGGQKAGAPGRRESEPAHEGFDSPAVHHHEPSCARKRPGPRRPVGTHDGFTPSGTAAGQVSFVFPEFWAPFAATRGASLLPALSLSFLPCGLPVGSSLGDVAQGMSSILAWRRSRGVEGRWFESTRRLPTILEAVPMSKTLVIWAGSREGGR